MKKFNYALNYSRIKELRESRNLTQKDIAKILNITQSVYSKYERTSSNITIEKLNDLANYYDVTLDYLLGLKNDKSKKSYKIVIDKVQAGKNLREIRLANNLYQDTLASLIGTSHSLISEYESGKKLISLTYGYAICKKLNVSMDDLYRKK